MPPTGPNPLFLSRGGSGHYLDVLWPQHEHSQTFTDEMSEQVIVDYVYKELIKNVTADNRHHLKSSPRNFSIYIKKGNYCIALCASTGTPRVSVGVRAARSQQSVLPNAQGAVFLAAKSSVMRDTTKLIILSTWQTRKTAFITS